MTPFTIYTAKTIGVQQNTKMKEVQSVSALHSSDKVVDREDKRNACPVALGTD